MAVRHRPGNQFSAAPELQQFLLRDVQSTGRQLGRGSYGVVEELEMDGVICAGKMIYDALIDPRDDQGTQNMVDKFYRECSLLSNLHHDNIVRFIGICFLPDSRLPVLVMERLDTSLDDLLENTSDCPLHVKFSILHDVAKGLVFLHNRNPVVVHRDLTARNVLLGATFKAKIADLGNARITDIQPGQIAQTMTRGPPGTPTYMPPEASTGHYGPSLDMFSFGHLSLFTAIQVFPSDLLPPTYTVDQTNEVRGRSELERRRRYITTLEVKLGERNDLTVFIKDCLANQPSRRPTASQALDRTRSMLHACQPPGSHFSSYHAWFEKEKELAQAKKQLTQMARELQQKDDKLKRMEQEQELQQKEATIEKISMKMEQISLSNKVNIFITGKTGAGKSTLLNALIGANVAREGRWSGHCDY